jgi:glycosyltransferase involved in cell wall biosynthesis
MEKHKEQGLRLAIVIPYFKIIFFEETIKSLANQTDKRFNLYIGDDASPEDPSQLLESYKNKLNFVYHRFDENLGSNSLVKQWNRCIGLTQDEEWIMILGDDDYLSNNVVESWNENYITFYAKSNLIRFASKILNQNLNVASEAYQHPTWEKAVKSFWRKYNNETRSSLSEHVFTRSSYKKYGFKNFPLAWNSDDCAWLDFSDNKPIYTINKSTVFVGISNSNISGKDDNISLKKDSYIAFYKYLISKKTKLFSKNELRLFMYRFEFEILRQRHLTISEWLYLFYNYIKNFDSIESKKFMKRFLNTILGRYER